MPASEHRSAPEGASEPAPSPQQAGSGNFLVPGAIVAAGFVVALAILYVGRDERSGAPIRPPASSREQARAGGALADLADDDPALGDPQAPVTLVEFGDFQCPFCGRFFQTTEREIIQTYVKTGKVRFVYRDFAFLGPESIAAAEAAECADEQGKFWPYHDYLYTYLWENYYAKNRPGENVGAFSAENLERFAADVGLDRARFRECLSSGRYREEVEGDTADGRAAGVNGTPTVFVNGRAVVGAVPFSQFKTVIDAALAEAE